jgi:phospholipid/cholesterol/gamma-HCH transport system ATP-binding protein
MRGRGVGFTAVLTAYQLGVSMFQAVAAPEFQRNAEDTSALQRTIDAVRVFVWAYIDRVTERLGEEYGSMRDELPGVDDPVWANPLSGEAARIFGVEQAGRTAEVGASARSQAERSMQRFRARIEAAATDEHVSGRLALAGTTIHIELADEPDLATTLQLDRDPIEVVAGNTPAEIDMALSSVDLERLWSRDFNLAMAIARGRVRVSGPVRKFLRVMPIVRGLAPTEEEVLDDGAEAEPEADDQEESKFDAATQAVLDQAADYQYHQGALGFSEEAPGQFWSIECRDVYKSFGSNAVLNGLNVGIPEGMITVVLGPSGTGKSVLISHLIGLMFPDQGEVLVHGRSVSEMRMSELLALRRQFGILFQDGALFGSMSVYDNVAFPLRQHTNMPEPQIAEIVNQRLAEVGLSGAGDRAPAELSGGMRKRAGFARALVLDPEIVMFDEPDSGLDPVRTALLCELIEQMHAEHGGTYIVITHDIASARRIAEYLVVLWKGRIVQSGDRDDMFTSRNPFVRQFLAGRPQGPLGME